MGDGRGKKCLSAWVAECLSWKSEVWLRSVRLSGSGEVRIEKWDGRLKKWLSKLSA